METILRFGRLTVLYDPDRSPNLAPDWFDARYWQDQGLIRQRLGGRGDALAVDTPAGPAVLRSYCRGGLIRHAVRADYLYLGLDATRPFREWRLTAALSRAGLPVPTPLAAAVQRNGLRYRAALMTYRLPGRPLSQVADTLAAEDWHRLGGTLKRFSDAGVVHPDLNAGNILVDEQLHFRLIDFDRARQARRPRDPVTMIDRLERSLLKLGLAHDRHAMIAGAGSGATDPAQSA